MPLVQIQFGTPGSRFLLQFKYPGNFKKEKKKTEILRELRQEAAATALGSMLPAFLGGDSLDAEASAQALIFLPTFPRAHCQHLFHLCGMKVTTTCSPVTLGLD